MSRFAPEATVRSAIRAVARPILRLWYIPCIPLLLAGCLIPLPLYPQEHSVPQILNPTPGDGTVDIDKLGDEETIQATITDPDTPISQMVVRWSVDDEDITYLSQQIPGGDEGGEFITAVLTLVYQELEDHDQDTIELYVSDRDNEVTEIWVLTVLGKP